MTPTHTSAHPSRSETVVVGDLRVAVERLGSGPPLLLLHGLGSAGADWRGVKEALAAHHEVIIPDARDHGQTRDNGTIGTTSPAFSVSQLAKDVAGLCAALGFDAVDVVGLSMGGMTTFQLAVDHPQLVKRAVVINAGPELKAHTFGEVVALGIRALLTVVAGPQRLAPVVVKRLFPKPEQQALRDEVAARIAANPPKIYRRATFGLVGFSVRDRLAAIQAPMLIVSGDRDYTSVESKRTWIKEVPGAEFVVVDDSGHATPGDQPARLTVILLSFLAGVQHPPLEEGTA